MGLPLGICFKVTIVLLNQPMRFGDIDMGSSDYGGTVPPSRSSDIEGYYSQLQESVRKPSYRKPSSTLTDNPSSFILLNIICFLGN